MLLWIALLLALQSPFVRECSSRTVIEVYDAGSRNNNFSEELSRRNDWQKHPCERPCQVDNPPMDCHYSFTIESYYVMSKACYNCPFNVTDCFRPHCVSADGVKRSIIVVDRQLPGPAIEVCKGDIITMNVTNAMSSESTTIHWHGQTQRLTPYMDGVPKVTQCPILPGETFRYTFIAERVGTHFWHSHMGLQRGDGMFGALIVREPPENDPNSDLFDYDEHSIVITDWIHASSTETFLAHYHSNGDNKIANLLINGLGRFQPRHDSMGKSVHMPTALFAVKQDSRYRFRLINAGFLNCPIELSIDDHVMYVVSTDGNNVEPVETESLVSYAGERFDFIVEMNQEIGNYWMRFRGLMDCDERFRSVHQVAILRYEGASKVDPTSNVTYFYNSTNSTKQVNALNKGTENNEIISMVTLESTEPDDITLKNKPDYKFYIGYDFYKKDHHHFHRQNLYGFHDVVHENEKVYTPQLNHISLKLPPFPLLSQRESIKPDSFCNSSTVKNCTTEFCSCTHVLQVKLNSVVELVLVDEGWTYDANHPFHLHGYHFRVIGMERLGKNTTVKEVRKLDEEGKLKRNLHRAPVKDTVTIPDGGFTIIRFYADNPGFWIFHCHIEFHAEVGMALLFKVGEYEDFKPRLPNFPRCGNYVPSDSQNLLISKTEPKSNVTKVEMPATTSTLDLVDNEVGDKSTDNKIVEWLPEILHKLHLTSSSTESMEIHNSTFGFCLIIIFINSVGIL